MPLIKTLAAMITLAPEYVVLQVYTSYDKECGPYVQTLIEDDGTMTLEAASNNFLSPPIGLDSINTLKELGWEEPSEHRLPNFSIFLEAVDVHPGDVSSFLVLTLRDAYLVSLTDQFECAPLQLFVEVVQGEFGMSPGMQFTPFDIDEWRRKRR
jgi:hypothetical protein